MFRSKSRLLIGVSCTCCYFQSCCTRCCKSAEAEGARALLLTGVKWTQTCRIPCRRKLDDGDTWCTSSSQMAVSCRAAGSGVLRTNSPTHSRVSRSRSATASLSRICPMACGFFVLVGQSHIHQPEGLKACRTSASPLFT
jgi:hypothetical protein